MLTSTNTGREPETPSSPVMRRLRLVDGGEAEVPTVSAVPAGHVRVAFATNDVRTTDAHFAGARTLAIYDVSANGHRLVEVVRFGEASAEDGVHGPDDDRIASRLQAISGCNLVFVLAIGGPAAARVVKLGVHPVKLPNPEPIADVIQRLKTMISGSPPPWLRKALRSSTDARPAFVDDEDDER